MLKEKILSKHLILLETQFTIKSCVKILLREFIKLSNNVIMCPATLHLIILYWFFFMHMREDKFIDRFLSFYLSFVFDKCFIIELIVKALKKKGKAIKDSLSSAGHVYMYI